MGQIPFMQVALKSEQTKEKTWKQKQRRKMRWQRGIHGNVLCWKSKLSNASKERKKKLADSMFWYSKNLHIALFYRSVYVAICRVDLKKTFPPLTVAICFSSAVVIFLQIAGPCFLCILLLFIIVILKCFLSSSVLYFYVYRFVHHWHIIVLLHREIALAFQKVKF